MIIYFVLIESLIEISFSQNYTISKFVNLNMTDYQVNNYPNFSYAYSTVQRETYDCLYICGANSTCNLVTIAGLTNNLKLCSFYKYYFINRSLALSPGTLVYYKKSILFF